MNNREFARILKRYRLGEVTESERALVEQWYALLDEQRSDLEIKDDPVIRERVWNRMEKEIRKAEPALLKSIPPRRLHIKKIGLTLAAASFIGVMIWLGIEAMQPTGNNTSFFFHQSGQYAVVKNTQNKPMRVDLPDSSMVRLMPGADISYPRLFTSDRREVFLNGEAYFNVRKNSQMPFYVYSGKITTHVLGTSFTIKPVDDNGKMEVAVHTGRVEVFETQVNTKRKLSDKLSNGVVLTPNQLVVYHEKTGVFEASVVSAPMPLTTADQAAEAQTTFVFSETPLHEVLNNLERLYGIEIIVEKQELNYCPFTGNLSRHNLFQKLDILNLALGTTYEVKGTRILIKGKGCN